MSQYEVDMLHIHGITPGNEQEVIIVVKALLAQSARVTESQMDWHVIDSDICPGKKHAFSPCRGLSMIGDMRMLTDSIMDVILAIDPVAIGDFFTREQVEAGVQDLTPNRKVLLMVYEMGTGMVGGDAIPIDTTLFAVFVPGTGPMPA